MLKCKSRIMREYKTRKADALWPVVAGKPNEHAEKYPEECGGEITLTVITEQQPFYGGCDTVMALNISCSRCKYPYTAGLEELRHRVAMEQKLDVSELLNDE